jgi:hypothetical protein
VSQSSANRNPPSSSSSPPSSPHEAAKPLSAICHTPCIRTLHLESHFLIPPFCFPTTHTTHLLVALPWLGSSSSPPRFTTTSRGEPNFCTWVTQLSWSCGGGGGACRLVEQEGISVASFKERRERSCGLSGGVWRRSMGWGTSPRRCWRRGA